MRILVVEDEKRIQDFLSRGLESAGYAVDVAGNGATAAELVHGTEYDLVILDLMLPDTDGLTVLEKIRNRKASPPVLILSARDAIDDRVKGLELGADDYLVKPFAFAELLARINALSRRPPLTDAPVVLRAGDLELDLLKRTVTRAGQPIELQPREFQLLEFLLRNADRVVTRTMLLEAVWDFHFDPRTNIVETHMSRLRAKLAQGGGAELIHTLRGAGYILRIPARDTP
jgi:two-component system, OmpR family, response regulator